MKRDSGLGVALAERDWVEDSEVEEDAEEDSEIDKVRLEDGDRVDEDVSD